MQNTVVAIMAETVAPSLVDRAQEYVIDGKMTTLTVHRLRRLHSAAESATDYDEHQCHSANEVSTVTRWVNDL